MKRTRTFEIELDPSDEQKGLLEGLLAEQEGIVEIDLTESLAILDKEEAAAGERIMALVAEIESLLSSRQPNPVDVLSALTHLLGNLAFGMGVPRKLAVNQLSAMMHQLKKNCPELAGSLLDPDVKND